ncbi:MAG TPA: type III-B CRISPR module RAMP protein Cmr4 [Candidatus Thiothrix moscowensis]|uniref:type III-B CRISPR module RAMP protein Cmr4 n=1 Tax=unclassified Thiothrix TaxID=2636184 RepID=UPI0025DA3F3F|nr:MULTISPECIES: type III-B CRISPR module RAMP protein Cmr4 [unclassified Thiothrix]HRJ53613.1 type III-B CRISPR module RAMP protein Cmr4 [Candidatus Thiothrix moscowensis]HRJ93694.1 type III-B CRISPR module RAMP protein Cmr4 [Candidatus Thiothrix moscowensis]
MTQVNTILGLLAQTSIHAGTGSNTGVIDLPIQREGHNGYPCIFGSSMKGALRTRAEAESSSESVKAVFGPDTKNASDHAGAIMVSDARLLLLPIRSLTSQFKWVTCPAVLQRFQRDAERFGMKLAFSAPEVANTDALVPQQTKEGALFLEEYRFDAKTENMDAIIAAVAKLMRDDAKAELEKQLVIVSNDMFTHLCQHATPVNAHIAIESETKTVKGGALWYEETLPPETLLYVGIAASNIRKPDPEKRKIALPNDESANWVLDAVVGLFKENPWLQIGGNETVGMGWCAVKALGGK